MSRHLGAERVPDDRGARPRWTHVAPSPGACGAFVVDRIDIDGLAAGHYFDAVVDYRRNFPDMPSITRVFERTADGSMRLWMTDGPQEVSMMLGLARGHRGHVLVTGLGLGVVQQRLLTRPDVTGVTTIEAHADVLRLHRDAEWFNDPRHEVVAGDATTFLPELVSEDRFDGYLLDHWETVGDNLDEKVAFLRLLDDHGQRNRAVSMWGFWWEVERTASSDEPDTVALLDGIERCTECGRILADRDDPPFSFSVEAATDGRCVHCADRTAMSVS